MPLRIIPLRRLFFKLKVRKCIFSIWREIELLVNDVAFFQICLIGRTTAFTGSSIRKAFQDIAFGDGYLYFRLLLQAHVDEWEAHTPEPPYNKRNYLTAEKEPRKPPKHERKASVRRPTSHSNVPQVVSDAAGRDIDISNNRLIPSPRDVVARSSGSSPVVVPSNVIDAGKPKPVHSASSFPIPRCRIPRSAVLPTRHRWKENISRRVHPEPPSNAKAIPRPKNPVSTILMRPYGKKDSVSQMVPLAPPQLQDPQPGPANLTEHQSPEPLRPVSIPPMSNDGINDAIPASPPNRPDSQISDRDRAPDQVIVPAAAFLGLSPTVFNNCLRRLRNLSGPVTSLSLREFIAIGLHARQIGHDRSLAHELTLSATEFSLSLYDLMFGQINLDGIQMHSFETEEGTNASQDKVCVYGCINNILNHKHFGKRQWLSGTKSEAPFRNPSLMKQGVLETSYAWQQSMHGKTRFLSHWGYRSTDSPRQSESNCFIFQVLTTRIQLPLTWFV